MKSGARDPMNTLAWNSATCSSSDRAWISTEADSEARLGRVWDTMKAASSLNRAFSEASKD